MIKNACHSFCESQYRWLIVTVGTFVVGLVLVLPLVDLYCAECNERDSLAAELDAARHIVTELDHFEERVAEKVADLQVLEVRTVDEESIGSLRGKLVDLARETGCSLRRIQVLTPIQRPWYEGDKLVAQKRKPNSRDKKTGFMLEVVPVNMSLSGSIASLKNLLAQLAEQRMLMSTKKLNLHPEARGRKTLTVDMEVWYFGLTRSG